MTRKKVAPELVYVGPCAEGQLILGGRLSVDVKHGEPIALPPNIVEEFAEELANNPEVSGIDPEGDDN